MRLKLSLDLENDSFPIDYRKNILSFIKFSMENYNKEYYEKLYNKGNQIKPYTFSVFFDKPIFENDNIVIKDKKFEINLSIADYEIAIILYNSLNNQLKKKFSIDKNSFTLKNISLIQEKQINSESITIKFMSPLLVRQRNTETKKDYYYSYAHEEFKEQLKFNIKQQLKITDIPEELVDEFDIIPIEPKKIVSKFYEKQLEGSLGVYKLVGDKKLLKYLYQSGMSSLHSSRIRYVLYNIKEVENWIKLK